MVTDKEWENHSEEWRDGYNAFNNGNVLKVDFSMMPKDWRDGARYAAQHPCGNAYTAITGRMLEKNRRYDITQNSICRSDRPDAVCVGVWHCLRRLFSAWLQGHTDGTEDDTEDDTEADHDRWEDDPEPTNRCDTCRWEKVPPWDEEAHCSACDGYDGWEEETK